MARAHVRASLVRKPKWFRQRQSEASRDSLPLGTSACQRSCDLDVFGGRDGDPDFLAVLTSDCRPPAADLPLVNVDNIRLINDRHESCFNARDSSPFRLHNSKRRLSAIAGHPPGKPSSRGLPCSGGNPPATWRTIAMISCTISPRAPPVAPLSKYLCVPKTLSELMT